MPELVSGQQQYFQAPGDTAVNPAADMRPGAPQITVPGFSLHLRGGFLQVHCLQGVGGG